MTPRYGWSAKSSCLVLGVIWVVDVWLMRDAEAGVGVVRLVPPGGVGMRG
jgi:hypothetical protein